MSVCDCAQCHANTSVYVVLVPLPRQMGLPLKPTTGSAGSSTMRLGATSSLAGTTMRPASAATDLTSTKRGGSNGGMSGLQEEEGLGE